METADSIGPNPGDPAGEQVVVTDMAALIASVHQLIDAREERAEVTLLEPVDFDRFSRETGFTPRRQGKPEMVLGDDVAVELGHPSTASQALVLITERRDLVRHLRVTRIGPDLDDCGSGERRPYAQVVMVEVEPGARPDPFEIDGAQFLINRLPGYMVRSIPGRLWVRVSKRGLSSGLRLATVGRALVAAFVGDFAEITGVELLFITSSVADVEALAAVALEAKVITGRHKKLAISPEGELECNELNCETCEEKPVCDDLRDVVRQRRRNRVR